MQIGGDSTRLRVNISVGPFFCFFFVFFFFFFLGVAPDWATAWEYPPKERAGLQGAYLREREEGERP